MPAHIKTALDGMIRDFIWEHDTAPRMALEYLYKPIDEGGLNILNISARNEAIEIIWLKSYLDITPSRPAWAIVTNLLINAAAPPGTSVIARINTFTQSWNPPMRCPRAQPWTCHGLHESWQGRCRESFRIHGQPASADVRDSCYFLGSADVSRSRRCFSDISLNSKSRRKLDKYMRCNDWNIINEKSEHRVWQMHIYRAVSCVWR